MPKHEYALERGGPKRLQISWQGFWKEVTASVDGKVLGVIPDSAALKAGKTLPLPDGSSLAMKLNTGFGNAGLELLRNGQPVPGSVTDPVAQFDSSVGIVYFIGGLSIAIGVLAAVAKVGFLQRMGIGIESAVSGVIYLGLGFWAKKARSLPAMIIAIVLFGLDGIYTVGAAMEVTKSPPVGAIIFRVLLITQMIRGAKALGEMKKT